MLLFQIHTTIINGIIKTDMPDNNPKPNTQPTPTPNPDIGGQVIQPSSSGATSVIPSSQPAIVVDGQSQQLTTPMPSSQFDQIPNPKPSKWRYFFIVLGILQAIGVAIFFIVITWAIQQAKAGVSGTEFIGLLVFVTVVPAVGLIALINLIGLPIYMIRHKPHGEGMVFSVLSLIISVILALYGAYSVYQLLVVAPKHINEQRAQTQQRIKHLDIVPPKEITVAEATDLLNNCKLNGLYYTKQNMPDGEKGGENTTTGILLTSIDGAPHHISIADRLIPTLVPIARSAQKTCPNLQFWHDGNYEQYQNGHWSFNGQVVN